MGSHRHPPLLQWTDDCSIGIEPLDHEHQDLLARLNELHEELLQHDDRVAMAASLGRIHARMAAHFSVEEKFMRDRHDPGYAAHKAEHDDLLEDFIEFMSRFRHEPELTYGEAEQLTLQRWVIEHMRTTDRRMGEVPAAVQPSAGRG